MKAPRRRSSGPRIGVFGGTFDPPHLGHVLAAHDARQRLNLDSVLLIPAFRPPHRPAPTAPYSRRVAMTERAVAGWPGLQVRAVEHTLPAPSYTVETLAALKRNFPRASLYLLLGRDQYADVGRWHRPAALTRLARIVVMNRPGVPRPRPCRLHRRTRVRFLDVIPVDIAAASVRSRLEQGKSVRYLVPAAVEDYIRSRDLYRKPATNRQEE